MEFTLLGAALTALVFAAVGLRARPLNAPDRPLDRLIGAALVGLFLGRLAAVVGSGINPLLNPGQMLLVRGGVDTVAASLGGTLALAWPLRRRLPALDNLAPVALLALAGWHAGCLWRSTCLGAASDLPWAWSLPGSDIDRHPVEIYAALGLLAGALLIAGSHRRPGTNTGLAIAVASLVRLVTEPIRPSLGPGPAWFYGIAVAIGVALAAWASRTRATGVAPEP
jgi:prolipoprotein diacylglyceryltransferase